MSRFPQFAEASSPLSLVDALDLLKSEAETADRTLAWPAASWGAVCEAGVVGWSIPADYGGVGLPPVELLSRHEQIAGACLTTSFILSQQEAAIRQLLKGPPHLRESYLPGLAAGDLVATVGLSQITTSRQHGGPALRATPITGGYRIDGDIPWVTAASQATIIVAGATLADGLQILFVLPTHQPGVVVQPAMPLAALLGSQTAAVVCQNVEIAQKLVLAGPIERVLGTVGGGGLETSNLALGLAVAALELIEREAISRPDLALVAARFRTAIATVREQLHSLCLSANADATLTLRVDSTQLALRSTQAALLIAKGAGFVAPQPAQRLARQAHFFLVWSCPRPVAAGVLDDLMPKERP